MAVGIGLTFSEATKAAQRSVHSGEIELFQPDDSKHYPVQYQKSDEQPEDWEIPPNLFDPKRPTAEDDALQFTDQPKTPAKPVLRPSVEKEFEAENQLLSAMGQQMMPEAQSNAPTLGSPDEQSQFQPRSCERRS